MPTSEGLRSGTVLKRDHSASIEPYLDLYRFRAGPQRARAGYSRNESLYGVDFRVETFDRRKLKARSTPVLITGVKKWDGSRHVLPPDGKSWWWFDGAFYVTEEELKSADVVALVHEKGNATRLRLEKAHSLMAMRQRLDTKAKRQSIPQEVKVAVWQRDNGRCVDCGSQTDLEFDHVIPVSMGGANTERNLQLLCAVCNRRKGGTLG